MIPFFVPSSSDSILLQETFEHKANNFKQMYMLKNLIGHISSSSNSSKKAEQEQKYWKFL
jgi:hypothetical protein